MLSFVIADEHLLIETSNPFNKVTAVFLHTTSSLNNWQLCVHLTILLLPIAGGTSDTVYTVGGHWYMYIQAQYTRRCVVAACAIYIMGIGQSI